jgi:hypothetical protein
VVIAWDFVARDYLLLPILKKLVGRPYLTDVHEVETVAT